MDAQGTKVVRKKVASYKSKIQVAEKRTEKAKKSLQVVEERFHRIIGMKSKMRDLISKREVQLERAETRINSIQLKWDALVRFFEEINVLVPGYDHSGLQDQEVEAEIAKFTEQTKNAERNYNASVDRERVLRDKTERARGRQIRAGAALPVLQQQLTAIKKRVQDLEERKLQRESRMHKMESLQAKVKQALAKAQEQENREAELEENIIMLEDQIERYVHKKKRATSILADAKNHHKSIKSWTISLWLQRPPLFNAQSTIPIAISGANDA